MGFFTKTEKKYSFAFIIHARDVGDFKSNYPVLKIFPNFILEYFSKFFPPFIISEVTGLSDMDGDEIRGCIISCPMTGKIMLANRELAKARVMQAAKLAERAGAKNIGLGAFTSPVTDGGKDLLGKVNLFITTGNTFTAAIAMDDIKNILNFLKKNISDVSVAVIGASGSIGSGIAKMLATDKVGSLILIGKTESNLKEVKDELIKLSGYRNAILSTDIGTAKDADFIIMATASSKALLAPGDIKKDAVVYSISQPSNISNKVRERSDIHIYEGGIVYTPGIKHKLKMGLRDEVNFACFSETMSLAAGRVRENFIGKVKVNNIGLVRGLAKKLKFRSALTI